MGTFSGKIKMSGAIGWAVEEQEPATLENPVDDGLGEVIVVQHIAPGGERWLVGGEQHRAAA